MGFPDKRVLETERQHDKARVTIGKFYEAVSEARLVVARVRILAQSLIPFCLHIYELLIGFRSKLVYFETLYKQQFISYRIAKPKEENIPCPNLWDCSHCCKSSS